MNWVLPFWWGYSQDILSLSDWVICLGKGKTQNWKHMGYCSENEWQPVIPLFCYQLIRKEGLVRHKHMGSENGWQPVILLFWYQPIRKEGLVRHKPLPLPEWNHLQNLSLIISHHRCLSLYLCIIFKCFLITCSLYTYCIRIVKWSLLKTCRIAFIDV